METKELVDKVMADLLAIREELKDFKGPVKDIVKNIPDVVASVEKLAADYQLIGDKKKEVAIAVLNRLIDIPWVPESAEAVLIGFGIDAVVSAFNKFGKDWIKKI